MASPPPIRIGLYRSASAFPEDTDASWNAILTAELLTIHQFGDVNEFVAYVCERDERLDCLVMIANSQAAIAAIGDRLTQTNRILPAIAIWPHTDLDALPVLDFNAAPVSADPLTNTTVTVYHKAVTCLALPSLKTLTVYHWIEEVEQAIAQFMQVSPSGALPLSDTPASLISMVKQQQQRLAEKLRERLGYAGVYYKRDPERFYRHLSEGEKAELMTRLQDLYRGIILDYFKHPERVNPLIDEFAALAFLADLSISQVLELHMTLMDQFAKQLKLERRSEEIVLDYRITLIDVIAHLSEMYRKSIPHGSKASQAMAKQLPHRTGIIPPTNRPLEA